MLDGITTSPTIEMYAHLAMISKMRRHISYMMIGCKGIFIRYYMDIHLINFDSSVS